MAPPVRVLVAGNDPHVCGPLAENLAEHLGERVEVHQAPRGEAARRLVSERFDLVFACGLDCAQELSTLSGGRPVTVVGVPHGDEAMMLSDLRGLRAAYLQRGASHFLPQHPAFEAYHHVEFARRLAAERA
jgi:hypothetical protein